MSALTFAVTGAQPAPLTAAPAIAFRLRIEHAGDERVHAIALRCQTRIEARRRRYAADEQARLRELFGDSAQWDHTLQAVAWSHTSIVVPSFLGSIDIDFTLPITYDLQVASAKYFHALRSGDVPLLFLFSGTVFLVRDGLCIVEPVPWDLEAVWRMAASVWHAAMDRFFPDEGWIRVKRTTIDRLQAFRGEQALVTWDDAIDVLLQRSASGQPV